MAFPGGAGPGASGYVEEGGRVRTLRRRLGDVSGFLRAAGSLLAARAQAAFREQRRGPFAWRPRSVPNVAGLVADLAAGGQPKARRFQDRPAGIDTGALRASVTYRIVGRDAVEVGSRLPYARRVQRGGRSTIPVPRAIEKPLAALLRRRPEHRGRLGFLFQLAKTGKALTITVPPRPFAVVTAEDHRDLRRLALRHVAAVRRGG